jgi:hypothetical protein
MAQLFISATLGILTGTFMSGLFIAFHKRFREARLKRSVAYLISHLLLVVFIAVGTFWLIDHVLDALKIMNHDNRQASIAGFFTIFGLTVLYIARRPS